jgi:hypothetical protein
MYQRFTSRAYKVMLLADREAMRFNHNSIATEHILLALLKQSNGVAAKVLRSLNVDLLHARAEVEKSMPNGLDRFSCGKLAPTPQSVKAIEYAIQEVRSLGHHRVGTEHILLGLLREQEGAAAGVLKRLGLSLDEVRRQVQMVAGHDRSFDSLGGPIWRWPMSEGIENSHVVLPRPPSEKHSRIERFLKVCVGLLAIAFFAAAACGIWYGVTTRDPATIEKETHEASGR